MDRESFDVIIIGGGLAGLSLAIQLADAKRNVLLFEKNKYPFHRVCGEYISMESWDFLERVGMPLREWNLPRITKLRVSSVNGTMIQHALDLGGFGISRYMLDHALFEMAKARGVTVMEESRADDVEKVGEVFFVSAKQEKYQSKVVVGAFGKRSNMDKKLERSFDAVPQPRTKNWVGVKYHVKSNLPENVIELHNFPGGYCGISKVEGQHYCLCYLTQSGNLKRSNGSIQVMEETILSQNPYLKEYFSTRVNFLFEQPETISQINFDNKLPVEKNILMTGDAAGMIAPLCGNGMSMAFQASAVCFPIVEKFLSGKISRAQMEIEYSTRWKSLFSMRLKAGRMLQPVLVKSWLSIPAIATLKYAPFMVNQIVKATHGKPF